MKVAISVPDSVFSAAERVAKERRMSRSQLYAEALAHYLGALSPDAITDKLNAVYGDAASKADSELDDALMAAQLGSLSHEAW